MKKNYRWYLIAFLIPVIVSLIIFIGMGIYPFGNNCILQMDMYHQYCPFFTEFLTKLQEGGSLMYSWNLGLGSDFVGLYAYYLASPLNWFLVLCPKNHVIEFMTLLTLLKLGLCGFSFFYFIKERYQLIGKDGKFHKNTLFPALLFSTAYVFSGFMAAYSWNIMWLDCIALAPLIVLGLVKLVKEKKVLLYYVALSIAILSNYYIAILLCIFLVLYFIILLFEQKKGHLSACCRFAGYSALAGGTASILLLPEIVVLSYSGSAGSGFPEKVEWYFSILAELARGSALAQTHTGNDHWPNLYAGAFSLIFIFLYILNRRIHWKEKIIKVFIVVFFLISFANNYLDFIWHGMHFPQSLPGRQSFLYAFLILIMGFETIRKWKGIRLWHIIAAFVIPIVLLVASAAVTDLEVTAMVSIVATCVLIACYALIMMLQKMKTQKKNGYLQWTFFVLAMVELIANMAITGYGSVNRTTYMRKVDYYEELLKHTQDDDSFYRVEDAGRKTKNDNTFYGYPSVTIFSSLMNRNVSSFYRNVYMEGGANYYCYNGATPITSAMLSVKYVLSDSAMEESPLSSIVAREGRYYLYENRYCLPFGYVIQEDAIANWEIGSVSKIGNINSLAKALGANENMLMSTRVDEEVLEGSTTLTLPEEGYYYALYDRCSTEQLTATFSSGRTKTLYKTTHRYLLDLGYCTSGETVTITNANDEKISFSVYRLNLNAVDAAYETLSEQTMELVQFEDTIIEGKIDITTPGRLILSVPSEPGWTLYVDGKETEIIDFSETFISTYLEEGIHTIRLEYQTPGLMMGAVIGAFCIGIFALTQIIRRLRCKKNLSAPKC